MPNPRTHYQHSPKPHGAICGKTISDLREMTADVAMVDCRACIKGILIRERKRRR